ncbi:19194_t:CDS:2, partial [Dentiscutata erythropus]
LKHMASSSFQFLSDNRQVQYQETDNMNLTYFQYFENYQEQYQDHLGGYQVNNHITSLENQQRRYQETDTHSETHQEGYQLLLENHNEQYNEFAYNAKSISLLEEKEPKHNEKESQCNERESLLSKREFLLNEREFQINKRESQLNKKEYHLKKEVSQQKTANAFLVYLRDILGDDFFLYHDKFLESLQNSSSSLEMKEERKRKAAACDICRGWKKRCVG